MVGYSQQQLLSLVREWIDALWLPSSHPVPFSHHLRWLLRPSIINSVGNKPRKLGITRKLAHLCIKRGDPGLGQRGGNGSKGNKKLSDLRFRVFRILNLMVLENGINWRMFKNSFNLFSKKTVQSVLNTLKNKHRII